MWRAPFTTTSVPLSTSKAKRRVLHDSPGHNRTDYPSLRLSYRANRKPSILLRSVVLTSASAHMRLAAGPFHATTGHRRTTPKPYLLTAWSSSFNSLFTHIRSLTHAPVYAYQVLPFRRHRRRGLRNRLLGLSQYALDQLFF